jgi:hypothetical protein
MDNLLTSLIFESIFRLDDFLASLIFGSIFRLDDFLADLKHIIKLDHFIGSTTLILFELIYSYYHHCIIINYFHGHLIAPFYRQLFPFAPLLCH